MKDRGYIERTEQVIEMGEDAIKKLAVEFIDGTEKKEKWVVILANKFAYRQISYGKKAQ